MQRVIYYPWIIHRKHPKDRETGKQEFYHKNTTTAATTELLEAEEYLQEILSTEKPHQYSKYSSNGCAVLQKEKCREELIWE